MLDFYSVMLCLFFLDIFMWKIYVEFYVESPFLSLTPPQRLSVAAWTSPRV